METRTETDPLGRRELPNNVYYGIQTLRAIENFPVSGIRAPFVFVRAYVLVKKAAAIANTEVGWLNQKRKEAIVKTCDEILDGKLMDQFVVDVFQAGAGTSFNMNVNEVVANRALEILGRTKGDYKTLSPNDHVNLGQSTNDTFPTALHVSLLIALKPLIEELDMLVKAFEKISRKHARTLKSGRTHLQDAVPLTIGQEFAAFASALKNACKQVKERQKSLYELALGGTAVGTGANAHTQYKKIAVTELKKMTGFPLKTARNPFEALQSCRAVQTISSALKELALELIRIANDLRLLSSGPTTGLDEIELPAVQPGSSIMPGKVNPVMAECLDMVAYQVLGNDLTVSFAVQAGQLDLNVMTPVIMHNLLSSIRLLTNYLPVFRKKCVEGITVNEERCRMYLEKNPALATFLSPYVGYLKASTIAKQALEQGRSVREIAQEKEILDPKKLEKILDPKQLIREKNRSN